MTCRQFVPLPALVLIQEVEARVNALDEDNTRLERELAEAGGRNEQLTIDRAELERTAMMKSGERGKSIADLRQRLTALEGEKVREVSSTYALSSFRELVPLRMARTES